MVFSILQHSYETFLMEGEAFLAKVSSWGSAESLFSPGGDSGSVFSNFFFSVFFLLKRKFFNAFAVSNHSEGDTGDPRVLHQCWRTAHPMDFTAHSLESPAIYPANVELIG